MLYQTVGGLDFCITTGGLYRGLRWIIALSWEVWGWTTALFRRLSLSLFTIVHDQEVFIAMRINIRMSAR